MRLLNPHVEANPLLRIDVVVRVLGRLVDIDLHPVNPSGESSTACRVVVRNRRTGFLAHIRSHQEALNEPGSRVVDTRPCRPHPEPRRHLVDTQGAVSHESPQEPTL